MQHERKRSRVPPVWKAEDVQPEASLLDIILYDGSCQHLYNMPWHAHHAAAQRAKTRPYTGDRLSDRSVRRPMLPNILAPRNFCELRPMVLVKVPAKVFHRLVEHNETKRCLGRRSRHRAPSDLGSGREGVLAFRLLTAPPRGPWGTHLSCPVGFVSGQRLRPTPRARAVRSPPGHDIRGDDVPPTSVLVPEHGPVFRVAQAGVQLKLAFVPLGVTGRLPWRVGIVAVGQMTLVCLLFYLHARTEGAAGSMRSIKCSVGCFCADPSCVWSPALVPMKLALATPILVPRDFVQRDGDFQGEWQAAWSKRRSLCVAQGLVCLR